MKIILSILLSVLLSACATDGYIQTDNKKPTLTPNTTKTAIYTRERAAGMRHTQWQPCGAGLYCARVTQAVLNGYGKSRQLGEVIERDENGVIQ